MFAVGCILLLENLKKCRSSRNVTYHEFVIGDGFNDKVEVI